MICAGKSIKTASARSSLLSPFSTSLRDVAASLAWNPILVIIWMIQIDWTSGAEVSLGLGMPGREHTFEFANAPHDFVDLFKVEVWVVGCDWVFFLEKQ